MKIKHKMENNTITLDVELRPKNHSSNTTITFDLKEVKDYCKENGIPIGELIYARAALCDNRTIPNSKKRWIFSIDSEYKKNLTKASKPATIKKEKATQPKAKKRSSLRERASRIARNSRGKKRGSTIDDSSRKTNQVSK